MLEPTMSRVHKIVNLIGVAVPFAGLIAAIALLWNRAIGPLELGLMVGLYVLTALGVTLGYHRMFTHRALESSRAFRAIIAVLGSMAVEGSVITWVADHRKHHAFTDQDGDPHSPHLSGPGLWGAVRGLFHAHVGWLFETVGSAERERFAPDLLKDRVIRVIDKLFFLWVVLTFAIPFALGWAIGGGIVAGLWALLWGGVVRVFLLHHVTWSINSVCHFFGRRRFVVEDESRNVFWLAPLSMGEAWHHNHHAFPTSAFHGLRLWERLADPTGLLIALLEKLGVVWNVVRVSPERQAAKALSGRAPSGSAA
jgi:stearoyl-CoA desaturase (delta-9 desaturase)